MLKIFAFLVTTIPALFAAFFSYFLRKHVTVVAGLLALAAMLAIFVSCINVILQFVLGLLVVPAWMLNAVGMFIPGNFALVLSAIVSGKICRAAFSYGVKKTDLVVKAN